VQRIAYIIDLASVL